MTTPNAKDLSALCEVAATLYHRLVLVVGPAGSGKTRLLQRTLKRPRGPESLTLSRIRRRRMYHFEQRRGRSPGKVSWPNES